MYSQVKAEGVRACEHAKRFLLDKSVGCYRWSAITGGRSGSHLRAFTSFVCRAKVSARLCPSSVTSDSSKLCHQSILRSTRPFSRQSLTTKHKAERSDGERSRAGMRVLVPGARQEVTAWWSRMIPRDDRSRWIVRPLRTRSRDARLRSWPGSSAQNLPVQLFPPWIPSVHSGHSYYLDDDNPRSFSLSFFFSLPLDFST